VITAAVADQNAKYDQSLEHKVIVYTNDKDEPKIEIRYRVLPGRPAPAPKKP
jgi:hypothetical protein